LKIRKRVRAVGLSRATPRPPSRDDDDASGVETRAALRPSARDDREDASARAFRRCGASRDGRARVVVQNCEQLLAPGSDWRRRRARTHQTQFPYENVRCTRTLCVFSLMHQSTDGDSLHFAAISRTSLACFPPFSGF
jgi:hypothetical protein